jgi:hypothetical protein
MDKGAIFAAERCVSLKRNRHGLTFVKSIFELIG